LLPEGRLAGPMPWVIVIMTFLTVLAVGAGVGLHNAASSLGSALAGRLTVQIVEANPDVRIAQSNAVVAELQRLSAVADVSPIDDATMRDLLAPWLGRDGLDADLPVPALIDVSMKQGDAGAFDAIGVAVRRLAPNARIDRHASWVGPLRTLLATLRGLALALVALMAVAMAAAVVLSARAALNTHQATIDVMHLMGATDLQVARLFQRRAALDAAVGGALGLILGAGIILGLSGQLGALDAALLDEGGLGWSGWLAILLVPVCVVALSVLTARITVLRALSRRL
jgi:cell division transport system permease protein